MKPADHYERLANEELAHHEDRADESVWVGMEIINRAQVLATLSLAAALKELREDASRVRLGDKS